MALIASAGTAGATSEADDAEAYGAAVESFSSHIDDTSLIIAAGDAQVYGNSGELKLNLPVVGMASTPSGKGYWLVASDGGIFAYGDAQFYGSTGAIKLNKPIVGMTSTASGNGYWFIAQDGGIFAYGDAQFLGTPAEDNLTTPVVGMAANPTGTGYWVVTGNGTVYWYGAAATGSAQDATSISNGQIVGIASNPSGSGYWLAANRTGPAASIWQSGGLKNNTLNAALALGEKLGIRTTVRKWGTLALLAHSRDGARVDNLKSGWRYSLSTFVAETGPSGVVIGGDAAAALDRGEVAVSFAAARQRGTRIGDVYTVQGFNGRVQNFIVGAIVADELVGTAEMVVSRSRGTSLGINKPSSVMFWYGGESADLIAGLKAIEATAPYIRSWYSWNPDPGVSDSVLSSAKLKLTYGDPAYKPSGATSVYLESSWYANNIKRVNLPIVGAASCNVQMIDDLVAALTQVQKEGLAAKIDVANFRLAGGCYNPRRIRGSSSLSRHSYGIAVDFNTSTNAYGATPTMDMRIVEIFRSNGFAWGGGWTRPDGMHFEHLGS